MYSLALNNNYLNLNCTWKYQYFWMLNTCLTESNIKSNFFKLNYHALPWLFF